MDYIGQNTDKNDYTDIIRNIFTLHWAKTVLKKNRNAPLTSRRSFNIDNLIIALYFLFQLDISSSIPELAEEYFKDAQLHRKAYTLLQDNNIRAGENKLAALCGSLKPEHSHPLMYLLHLYNYKTGEFATAAFLNQTQADIYRTYLKQF